MPDMYKKFTEEIVPKLVEKRGYRNINLVPRMEKIIISTGISSGAERDTFPECKQQVSMIAGQAAVITKSKRDISNFKLRKGMPVGVMVTLRSKRMYEFLDRFIHNALPRVRDFRGIPLKGFDGRGNYNMGLKDVTVFTEVDMDKLKHPFGLNICFVTTAKTDDEAQDLLRLIEMPFGEQGEN